MTVAAADLLGAANKSQGHAICEADWRGVCARAYYAIYQDGRQFHDNLPAPGYLKPDSKGGLHENLIERLQNPGIDKSHADYMRSRRVGFLMASLHASRVKADYYRDKDIAKATADASVSEAQKIFKELYGNAAPLPLAQTSPTTPSAIAPSTSAQLASPVRPSLTRIK